MWRLPSRLMGWWFESTGGDTAERARQKKKHPTKNTVHIASNKNTVPGDVSAMVAGGIRIGEKLMLLFWNLSLKFLCH